MRIASFDIGTRNFAFCIVDTGHDLPGKNPVVRVVQWEVTDVKGRTAASTLDNVTALLFANEHMFSTCDMALVEKQLAACNFAATRLAYHVESWFSIVLPNVRTAQYHAHNKTSFFLPPSIKLKDKRHRKWFCVSLAIEYLALTGQQEMLADLLSAPKKDDMADTLCQALAYLKVRV